jgi:3-deoxy-D-manno-octulosonate 8-phosphate phosphatase (KDO 8-P phosphatase)
VPTPPPGNIKLLVLDVDGVLTDGGLYSGPNDIELKRYDIKDGFAMRAAMKNGLKVGVLTARESFAVAKRCRELEIELLIQGSPDKARDVQRLSTIAGVPLTETAYLGDDLIDLPVMSKVAYPMAVADAAPEIRQAASFVTGKPGGHGAVREAIEHLLAAQGKWERIVAQYRG